MKIITREEHHKDKKKRGANNGDEPGDEGRWYSLWDEDDDAWC